MFYYLLLIPILSALIVGFFFKKSLRYSNTFAFLYIILLIVVASIREGVGTDFNTYRFIWNNTLPLNTAIIAKTTGVEYLEPGFRYFLSTIKLISDSQILFFTAMAMLTLCFLYFGLTSIPDINIYLSITIYFMIFYMPYTFNGMRQALSMSIFVYSLDYIVKNDFKKTFILSLLAASFHSTGILIIVSYCILNISIKMNIFFYFFLGFILSILLFYSSYVQNFINLMFHGKFSFFEEQWGGTSFFQLLTRTLITLIFVFFIEKSKSSYLNKIIYIYLFGFFIYLILLDSNMMATRFNMFFRILEIIIFPMIIHKQKEIINKIILLIILFIISFYIFHQNISNPDNLYQTIL